MLLLKYIRHDYIIKVRYHAKCPYIRPQNLFHQPLKIVGHSNILQAKGHSNPTKATKDAHESFVIPIIFMKVNTVKHGFTI